MRIACTTVRGSGHKHFSMAVQYELEDAFCRCTGATLLDIPVPPPMALFRRGLRKLGWGPQVHLPSVDEGLDLLFVPSMAPFVVSLDHIADLRRKARCVIYYLFDAWPVERKVRLLQGTVAAKADLLCVSFLDALEPYSRVYGPRVLWIPQATEPTRFYPGPDERGVFCCAMGRQDEEFFERTRTFCRERDLLFVYSSQHGGFRRTWEHDRDFLAMVLRHSRYTLNWSGRETHASWKDNQGADPVTCRWFEAAAAGTEMVGNRPVSREFDLLFPPDAVVDVRLFDRNPIHVFNALAERDPVEVRQRLDLLSQHVLSKHTWYNRVYQILKAVDMTDVFRLPSGLSVPLDLSDLPVTALKKAPS